MDKDKYHIHQQAYPFVNGAGFHSETGYRDLRLFQKEKQDRKYMYV
jgi:hypothetical protein